MFNLNFEHPDWALILPQLIVFLTAIALVLGDAFLPERSKFNALTGISLVGYGAALASLYWQRGKDDMTFQGSFRADGLTVFLSLIILIAAILSVLVSANYIEYFEDRVPLGEYYILLAFSVVGALLVAGAGDMIMIFIGLELSSLATYVLTAYARRRVESVEGALKYFLLGIFASAILLYGMAWAYGLSGSTDLDGIRAGISEAVAGSDYMEASVLLALLLLVVGLGFKIAAVPFHMWTPDAYEGAPTPVSAYMSVIPKAAGFAALIRILVQALGPLSDDWTWLIAGLALITMALGNFVALSQRNVKRMLAYSSIAHTGYMMVGLAAYQDGSVLGSQLGADGVTALMYYMLAYAFMNIGAFAVLAWLQERGKGVMLDDLSGLAGTHPLAAVSMAVFMISLMGIPPLIGFYAKYYVIVAAIEADMLWLAIAIVLMSALSAYFYLRVVFVMYFGQAPDASTSAPARTVATPLLNAALVIMVVGNLALGLFSQGIIDLGEEWNTALTLASNIPGVN
ncbi:MAG: NADH-quinone oxidoreductase subunit N [Thermomicrobiales bacterium]|nr:NADH-quinone oxidoreductase subunit N [Thermomicrobiales bacterium]